MITERKKSFCFSIVIIVDNYKLYQYNKLIQYERLIIK